MNYSLTLLLMAAFGLKEEPYLTESQKEHFAEAIKGLEWNIRQAIEAMYSENHQNAEWLRNMSDLKRKEEWLHRVIADFNYMIGSRADFYSSQDAFKFLAQEESINCYADMADAACNAINAIDATNEGSYLSSNEAERLRRFAKRVRILTLDFEGDSDIARKVALIEDESLDRKYRLREMSKAADVLDVWIDRACSHWHYIGSILQELRSKGTLLGSGKIDWRTDYRIERFLRHYLGDAGYNDIKSGRYRYTHSAV